MRPTDSILPTRGSTPTAADRKLAKDLRRIVDHPSGKIHALTLDEGAALVAAHRCRAEEAVWTTVAKAAAA